ncbi:hypothetical protein BCR36DRAFT_330685 [Piromyces finnis]|uniref:alpha-galactosidase n=1 Tax=Piromyces finnis TaxID=1754191 RepID=A0A1Y1V5L5_9FUNG|nr:hypothetical protein BCR36DRAFT_330685 [Piromyces finnis]|eukprot:ORX47321.1 hypothetical protein BCR36DRAFT_330685 [Piromyces finnis]
MNIKNLSLIILFLFVCFTCTSEAKPRRNRGRAGRTPKKSDENPIIKFRQSVEKYKKIREEKRKRSLLLQKRNEFNYNDEIYKTNTLLLLAKHDTQGRKLFEFEGNNLIHNEYVIETVPEQQPLETNNNYNILQFNTNVQNKQIIDNNNTKMAFKITSYYSAKMRTIVKTIKKTITSVNIQPKTTRKVYTTTVKKATTKKYTTTKKTTTTKINTTTINTTTRNLSTTTKKNIITKSVSTYSKMNTTTNTISRKTTTIKNIAVTNNAVDVNSNRIYQPKPGTKFQWQLSGCNKVDTSVNADIFDLDLFETPVNKIKELKNKGKKVICYFSGGTIESWRDDAEEFLNKGVVLEEMEDWEDENWVNIRSSKLKPLIQNRLDLAVEKDCDGVEIDNVDGYTFKENDFTYNEQLNFNKWLADEAHKRKLSIGLKNDMEQIKDLLPYYDWALNEECYEYGECELYKPFIQANKAVFGVSYLKNTNKIANACKLANQLKLDYQIKNLDLDASKIDCSLYK